MRYHMREIMRNQHVRDKDLMKRRNKKMIYHYDSPEFADLTEKQIDSLNLVEHVWTLGDRYWKLAAQYYGNTEMWWVIAWVNRSPTEAHIDMGEIIEIPFPLERVLEYSNL